jgi:hypothetical protein
MQDKKVIIPANMPGCNINHALETGFHDMKKAGIIFPGLF